MTIKIDWPFCNGRLHRPIQFLKVEGKWIFFIWGQFGTSQRLSSLEKRPYMDKHVMSLKNIHPCPVIEWDRSPWILKWKNKDKKYYFTQKIINFCMKDIKNWSILTPVWKVSVLACKQHPQQLHYDLPVAKTHVYFKEVQKCELVEEKTYLYTQWLLK